MHSVFYGKSGVTPFAVWGLDIVGPLRKAHGGYTHLLVAIDKFSKSVEVRPITNLRAEQAVTLSVF
jgi:hypothetical protein